MTDKKQDAGAVERIVAEMRASATELRCKAGESTGVLRATARANALTVNAWADEISTAIGALLAKTACTMGVGEGSGQLFVHGDYDSIKAAQRIVDERDALRERCEALENVGVRIEELHMKDGRIDARFTTEMATILAQGYLDLCDEHGAQNYLQLSFADKKGREVIVTVQRAAHPTPHDLRIAADRRAEAAEQLAAELRQWRFEVCEAVGLCCATGHEWSVSDVAQYFNEQMSRARGIRQGIHRGHVHPESDAAIDAELRQRAEAAEALTRMMSAQFRGEAMASKLARSYAHNPRAEGIESTLRDCANKLDAAIAHEAEGKGNG